MSKTSDILESTTDEVRSIISKILEIEREYENKKNIHLDKSLEKQIGDRVCKVMEKEVAG